MSQTEHRPVLIVIAGPNGSGKTTITSKILRHEWLEGAESIGISGATSTPRWLMEEVAEQLRNRRQEQ